MSGAGVPQAVNPQTGEALGWLKPQAIATTMDQGGLGTLSNNQARVLIESMMWIWEETATATLHFEARGQLDQDVTAENVMDYLGKSLCGKTAPDGTSPMNPIVFDADGSIIDLLAGVGASKKIVGQSAFRCFEGTMDNPSGATQAFIVMNGKFSDGNSDGVDLDINTYAGVILHELGHFLGLHHSMVNEVIYEEIIKGKRPISDSRYLPVMFPLVVQKSTASTVLKPDDIAAISSLYPTEFFQKEEVIISGDILDEAGYPVFAANVVVRDLHDPLCYAVSAISGRHCALLQDSSGKVSMTGTHCGDEKSQGHYTVRGLIAGSYTVEVSEIVELGETRSSMFPKMESVDLPGNAEFYNENESAYEDADLKSTVEALKGERITGIDIILDGDFSKNRRRSIDVGDFTLPEKSACGNDVVAYGDLVKSIAHADTSFSADETSGAVNAGCQLDPSRGVFSHSSLVLIMMAFMTLVVLQGAKGRYV